MFTSEAKSRIARSGAPSTHACGRLNVYLVLERVDMKTAQTRLGHSDPLLTLADYAQATTEADQAAAEAVGRRFSEAIGKRSRDGGFLGDC